MKKPRNFSLQTKPFFLHIIPPGIIFFEILILLPCRNQNLIFNLDRLMIGLRGWTSIPADAIFSTFQIPDDCNHVIQRSVYRIYFLAKIVMKAAHMNVPKNASTSASPCHSGEILYPPNPGVIAVVVLK